MTVVARLLPFLIAPARRQRYCAGSLIGAPAESGMARSVTPTEGILQETPAEARHRYATRDSLERAERTITEIGLGFTKEESFAIAQEARGGGGGRGGERGEGKEGEGEGRGGGGRGRGGGRMRKGERKGRRGGRRKGGGGGRGETKGRGREGGRGRGGERRRGGGRGGRGGGGRRVATMGDNPDGVAPLLAQLDALGKQRRAANRTRRHPRTAGAASRRRRPGPRPARPLPRDRRPDGDRHRVRRSAGMMGVLGVRSPFIPPRSDPAGRRRVSSPRRAPRATRCCIPFDAGVPIEAAVEGGVRFAVGWVWTRPGGDQGHLGTRGRCW